MKVLITYNPSLVLTLKLGYALSMLKYVDPPVDVNFNEPELIRKTVSTLSELVKSILPSPGVIIIFSDTYNLF
jgi:hypothetical protein